MVPIVIGLDNGKPIVYNYDAIGTQSNTEKYCAVGTAGVNFNTLMENYFRPDMTPQDLETTLSELILSGMDRDILSGMNASVYVLTGTELKVVDLKTKKV